MGGCHPFIGFNTRKLSLAVHLSVGENLICQLFVNHFYVVMATANCM